MTPSPADSSPLDTLRQLKVLLDQGAITPAEYDTLKQRLLTGLTQAPTAVADAPAAPSFPASAPTEPMSYGQPAPPAPTGELPSLLDMFQQTAASAPPPAPLSMPAPAPKPVPVALVVVSPPTVVPPEVNFLPRKSAEAEMRPLSEFLPPAASVPAAPAAPVPPVYAAPTPPVAPPPPPPVYSAPIPAAARPYMAPAPPESEWITSPAPAEVMSAEPDEAFVPAPTPPTSRALPTVLLVLGGLALLLVLGYLFMGREQTDEHLTSLSKTAADSVAVQAETGPQAEQLDLPPAAEPEVVRPVLAAPSFSSDDSAKAEPAAEASPKKSTFPAGEAGDMPAATAPVSKSKPTAPAPAPTPKPAEPAATEEPTSAATAPEDGDDEATTQVRQALTSYYTDLQAPPFKASQHFAPVVERLYTRQNMTPAAIEADMDKTLFPEFKQRTTTVVPGTLRVGPPAADGTRTATYTEQSRAFRVSQGRHQRTRPQVRVRFDPDYKMTYLRQEKLLENTFE